MHYKLKRVKQGINDRCCAISRQFFIARAIYADLNRDGYSDTLFEAVAPSSRYPINIVLPQAYISDSQGEYCYARLASNSLHSSWDSRAQSGMAILDAESTRPDLDLMQCTSR